MTTNAPLGTSVATSVTMAAVGAVCIAAGLAIGMMASDGCVTPASRMSDIAAPAPAGAESYGGALSEPQVLVAEPERPTPEEPVPTAAAGEPSPAPMFLAEPVPPAAPLYDGGWGQALEAAPPAAAGAGAERESEPEAEALVWGPVHEALTEVIAIGSADEPGAVAPQEPPADVEEVLPGEKPAGQDVVWIPGYWSWDDEGARFVWVSGLWRRVPQGCRWVPGYWTSLAAGGYRWVGGFWIRTDREVVYLPPPPESLEAGELWQAPPAPAADAIWVPGYWDRIGSGYIWRAGYWMDLRPDWVWVPAHYRWTPRGWLFVPGYWDYPLESRGLLFAPVVFRGAGVAIIYRPSIVIEIRQLVACLFYRPRERRCYFGDYFDARQRDRGIYPWFEPRERRERWCDPALAHVRAIGMRQDRRWDERLRADFEARVEHPERRQPVGTRFDRVVAAGKSGPAGTRFEPVSQDHRARYAADRKALRDYAETRRRLESRAVPERPEPSKPVERPVDKPDERPGAIRQPEPRQVVPTPIVPRRGEPERPTAMPVAPVVPARSEPRKPAEAPEPKQRAEPRKTVEEPAPRGREEPKRSSDAPAPSRQPEPRKIVEKPLENPAVVRQTEPESEREPKQSSEAPPALRRSEPRKIMDKSVEQPAVVRPEEPKASVQAPVVSRRGEPERSPGSRPAATPIEPHPGSASEQQASDSSEDAASDDEQEDGQQNHEKPSQKSPRSQPTKGKGAKR